MLLRKQSTRGFWIFVLKTEQKDFNRKLEHNSSTSSPPHQHNGGALSHTCDPRGRVGWGSISIWFSSEPLSEHQVTELQPVLMKNKLGNTLK